MPTLPPARRAPERRAARSPLRHHRILLGAGGALVFMLGLLYGVDPAGALGETAARVGIGLAAGVLVALTFVSEWVRRNAIGFVYGFFIAVSAWQIWLAHANALSAQTAFGLILVFIGCSAGFQTFRALGLYSAVFVAAATAMTLRLPDPGVPTEVFLPTLAALGLLGTVLFRMRAQVLDSLDAARRDALAAAQAKSGFLATMSHEIRTPLNGVIGMTDVLATTPLSAEQREALATIRASGDALLGVITDILDFSKIEAGHVELERQPVCLRALVEDTVAVVALDAARRGVETVGHVCPGVPVVVGDATRLRQILLNLLSNAVKFTPAGEVVASVSASVRGSTVDLHVAVSDTGIGIPATASTASSSRSSRSTPRRRAATVGRASGSPSRAASPSRWAAGCGPSPSPAAARRSTSRCRCPSRARVGRPARARARSVRGQTVLVVDDSPAAAEVVADLAREAGFTAHVALSVEDALAFLDGGGRYAVAVVDHDIGGVPGARGRPPAPRSRLRRRPPDRRHVAHRRARPRVARRRRRRAAAGPRRGLPGRYPRPRRPGRACAAAAAPDAPVRLDGLRVLLAEDHPVNQRVAVGLLRHLGIAPDVVETGRAAVAAVAAGRYDAVLMDVQMPEMDGLDATRAIRPAGGPQPAIIALTANAVVGDAERCRAAGMDDYLVKPVRLDALADALGRVAARGAGRRAGLRRADAPSSGRPQAACPARRVARSPRSRRARAGDRPLPALPTRRLAAHLRVLTSGDVPLADEILATYLATDTSSRTRSRTTLASPARRTRSRPPARRLARTPSPPPPPRSSATPSRATLRPDAVRALAARHARLPHRRRRGADAARRARPPLSTPRRTGPRCGRTPAPATGAGVSRRGGVG